MFPFLFRIFFIALFVFTGLVIDVPAESNAGENTVNIKAKNFKIKKTQIQSLATIPEQLTVSEEAEVDKMVLPVPAKWMGDFDEMRKRRHIRILVPYSKTFFSVDRGKQQGIDYDSGKALEKYINQKYPAEKKSQQLHVVFIPVKRDQILPALVSGKGDIAAGGLTVTERRKQAVDFVTPMAKGVPEVLITAPGFSPVETFLRSGSWQ